MSVFHDDEPLDPTTYPDGCSDDYGQQEADLNGNDEDEGLLHDGD
ncbi:MAG: hypothetical protein JWN27_2910 [Candidatus Eremiobacteraeota bacterium]|nr:hypothetical protein [Candidatus Eremiobacteraeota bacterium]